MAKMHILYHDAKFFVEDPVFQSQAYLHSSHRFTITSGNPRITIAIQ